MSLPSPPWVILSMAVYRKTQRKESQHMDCWYVNICIPLWHLYFQVEKNRLKSVKDTSYMIFNVITGTAFLKHVWWLGCGPLILLQQCRITTCNTLELMWYVSTCFWCHNFLIWGCSVLLQDSAYGINVHMLWCGTGHRILMLVCWKNLFSVWWNEILSRLLFHI